MSAQILPQASGYWSKCLNTSRFVCKAAHCSKIQNNSTTYYILSFNTTADSNIYISIGFLPFKTIYKMVHCTKAQKQCNQILLHLPLKRQLQPFTHVCDIVYLSSFKTITKMWNSRLGPVSFFQKYLSNGEHINSQRSYTCYYLLLSKLLQSLVHIYSAVLPHLKTITTI